MEWVLTRILSTPPRCEFLPNIEDEPVLSHWSTSVFNLAQKVIDSAKEAIVNKKQCSSISSRCSEVLEYVRYWRALFEAEMKSSDTRNVGNSLLLVLDRAMELVKIYGAEMWLNSAVIWQENSIEFEDVLHDITKYVQMVNGLLIEHLVCEQEESLKEINHLQKKIIWDDRITKACLRIYSGNDIKALMKLLEDWNPPSDSHGSLLKHLQRKLEIRINGILPEPREGQSINKEDVTYVEDDLLGEGALSKVYKGTFSGLHVAVKETTGTAERRKQAIMAGLQRSHPQVVQYIGDYKHNDKTYLVMELMQTNLEEVIKENAPFFHEDATDIMLQIAKGTDYLHRHGIIYGDMEPSNTLVNVKYKSVDDTPYFQIKLADFGGSKTEFHSSNMISIGSRKYVAPEISSSDGESYSISTDIYSFGVTCYDILTGNLHELQPALPLEVPKKLCDLLEQCCNENPANRPSDFGVILQTLWEIKEEVLTSMENISPSTSSASSGVSKVAIEGLMVKTEGTIGKQVIAQWGCLIGYNIFAVQWDRVHKDGTTSVILRKPIIVEQGTKASYILNADDLGTKIRVHCLPINNYCLAGQRGSATIDDWVSCDSQVQQKIDAYLASDKAVFTVSIDGSSPTKKLYLNSKGYRICWGHWWNKKKFVEDYTSSEIRLSMEDQNMFELQTEEKCYKLVFEDPETRNVAVLTMREFKQRAEGVL